MKAILGLLVLALAGCATNGYEKYYTPQPKAAEIVASPLIDKPLKRNRQPDGVLADAPIF